MSEKIGSNLVELWLLPLHRRQTNVESGPILAVADPSRIQPATTVQEEESDQRDSHAWRLVAADSSGQEADEEGVDVTLLPAAVEA